MSQVLEQLIEKEVRPRAIARSKRNAAQAAATAGPLIAAAGGTSTPPSGLGTEFDELLYDILIPAVAKAIQQYIQTTVITNPGQPVTVAGPTGALVGATTGPGTLTAL